MDSESTHPRSLLDWSEDVERRWLALRDWWWERSEVRAGLVVPPEAVGHLVSVLARVLEAEAVSVNGWLVEQGRRSPYWDSQDCDQRLRGLLQTAWERFEREWRRGGQRELLLYDFELLFALRLHQVVWRSEEAVRLRCLWLVPGRADAEGIWYYGSLAYRGQRLPGDWLSPAQCWVIGAPGEEPQPLRQE